MGVSRKPLWSGLRVEGEGLAVVCEYFVGGGLAQGRGGHGMGALRRDGAPAVKYGPETEQSSAFPLARSVLGLRQVLSLLGSDCGLQRGELRSESIEELGGSHTPPAPRCTTWFLRPRGRGKRTELGRGHGLSFLLYEMSIVFPF